VRTAVRRLAHAGVQRVRGRAELDGQPPPQPVGAKLELTHACNLRCGFCYTDSPRRTLERRPELDDAQWLRVIDEVIEMGSLEAVVTGGEPLLRRDLMFEVLERLDRAGIQTSLNTNGWFLDADVARRLSRLTGLRVLVSLDGPTPDVHDEARGVPGSWRRAVHAIASLAQHGVRVNVVSVITPRTESTAATMLDCAWQLGAGGIRLAPVVEVGAASRGGEWRVNETRLRRAIRSRSERYHPEMGVFLGLTSITGASQTIPRTLLVGPDGAVRIDSINPFRFGHAIDDGLAASWQRIVAEWDSDSVRRWKQQLRSPRRSAGMDDLVAYRSDAVDPRETPGGGSADAPPPRLPRAVAPRSSDPAGAGELVRSVALERRFRLGPVRCSDGENGSRYVRVDRSAIVHLNRTSALVMDACAPGTTADAVDALQRLHPGVARARLEGDAIDSTRRLWARGILEPAPLAPVAE
jgi:MoaA/NifB/PqqE/SkfB family radical SAM enzyme